MRQQMFTYRAASFFCKAYAPELLLGIDSVEEIEDVIDVRPMGPQDVDVEKLAQPYQQEAPPAEEPEVTEVPGENWWENHAHWRFRKSFDFFLAVMAGFNYSFPPLEENNSVEIDGNTYQMDMDALALFTTFKQSNPNAIGSLHHVSKPTLDTVRRKFTNYKIDASLFDLLQAGGAQ